MSSDRSGRRRSQIQMYSSVTSAPIMTIAGLFIGYYTGESISPGIGGTIGAFVGAFLFMFIGLIEVFNTFRKESKAAKARSKKEEIRELINKETEKINQENLNTKNS